MSKIYIICPVRRVTREQTQQQLEYVARLEAQGHEVHWPPRDVDQTNDDGGVRICTEHRAYMGHCDRVDIFWTADASTGSHFDAGMAYMLQYIIREQGLPELDVRLVGPVDKVPEKSFQNVVVEMCRQSHEAHKHIRARTTPKPADVNVDSGDQFLGHLQEIASEDAAGLKEAYKSYGDSWKKRGGVGAFMMLARKWDRLENRVRKLGWDIFRAIFEDTRGEGVIDDVRDQRRYLLLVEAETRARGFRREHRDNKTTPASR